MEFNPQWGNAIASIETGGKSDPYTTITPNPNGRRALGKYQVMEENLPEWTQAALGRKLTADQYLADKDAQETIFRHRFGGYVEKYGNPQDAASAWFTGRPQATGANAQDVLGTTGSAYVNKFNKHMGASPTGSTAMGFAPEEDTGALTAAARVGQGILVPGVRQSAQAADAPYDWRGRLTNFAAALSSSSDPEQAKVLLAANAARAKENPDAFTIHVDPKTGVATRLNTKTGQVMTQKVQDAQPEKSDYTKAEEKAWSEKNHKFMADAQASQASLGNLETLKSAINSPDVTTGPGAETANYLKKLGNTYFGMDFKGVADADTAVALMNKMTQESRLLNGGMPGSLSDKDLAFLKAANPSLDKSKEANNRIIEIYEKLHKANVERDALRAEYTAGGSKPLDEGFNAKLTEYYKNKHAEDNAAFKRDGSVTTAAPAAPAGQRQFKTPGGQTINWSYNP